MSAPETASGWVGILNPGERILWQGQPDASIDLSPLSLRRAIPALFMAGFAIFWTRLSLGALDQGPIGLIFPLFGLFFLTLALHQAGGHVLVTAWRRRHIWYTLTTQRAFIASDFLRRRTLDAYPITAETIVAHEDLEPGNLWFATDFATSPQGSKRVRIGFERLPDSRHVNDLIRQVQREKT